MDNKDKLNILWRNVIRPYVLAVGLGVPFIYYVIGNLIKGEPIPSNVFVAFIVFPALGFVVGMLSLKGKLASDKKLIEK